MMLQHLQTRTRPWIQFFALQGETKQYKEPQILQYLYTISLKFLSLLHQTYMIDTDETRQGLDLEHGGIMTCLCRAVHYLYLTVLQMLPLLKLFSLAMGVHLKVLCVSLSK